MSTSNYEIRVGDDDAITDSPKTVNTLCGLVKFNMEIPSNHTKVTVECLPKPGIKGSIISIEVDSDSQELNVKELQVLGKYTAAGNYSSC